MGRGVASGNSRDLLSIRWSALVLFWLPAIAICVSASERFSAHWRTIVWTGALALLGTACIANALRCGRTHCYLTGPFFLLMGLVTCLYGVGAVRLGRNGWGFVGLAILVGALALCCLPEMIWGRYRSSSGATANRG